MECVTDIVLWVMCGQRILSVCSAPVLLVRLFGELGQGLHGHSRNSSNKAGVYHACTMHGHFMPLLVARYQQQQHTTVGKV